MNTLIDDVFMDTSHLFLKTTPHCFRRGVYSDVYGSYGVDGIGS
jgi:hypothetical protein